MKNKLYANKQLIANFKDNLSVQDKLGKLRDFDINNEVSYNEQFLYKIIGNYFASLNTNFRKTLSGVWKNVFRDNYADQLEDLKKVCLDISNYPKELEELIN